MKTAPTLADIRRAAERIAPYAHRTPVLTCGAINQLTGAELYFKCENFQKVGAFKFRGACNTVMGLTEEVAAKGVATHSSGNHAQALALAARLRNIPAHIVMPSNAPEVKKRAVKDYGANITLCEPTLQARETTLKQVVDKTNAEVVHPYNDYRVICGQGTAALELHKQVGDLNIIMAPVGGGGLLSGTALATHYLHPECEVIAAEPAGADDAWQSFKAGRLIPSHNPNTIADGLLTSLGDKTFPLIQRHVNDILTVDEETIIYAMRLTWERMKIIIEASCAVPLAAILTYPEHFKQKQVGIILTGGNVDLEQLPF
ncbi:MAG: pyridoxal-phosphate dependent enzyme [Calditrichia bacterium]